MESIIIPESKHKFIGVGDIVYNYDRDIKRLFVTVGGLLISSYGDSWAEGVWKRLIFNNIKIEEYIRQEDVIKAACEVCITNEDELKSTKRDENIVFARHLIMWSLRVKLKYSLSGAAKPISKSHCLVIHAIKCIETEDKYLKDIHRHWKREFLERTFNQL